MKNSSESAQEVSFRYVVPNSVRSRVERSLLTVFRWIVQAAKYKGQALNESQVILEFLEDGKYEDSP